eukprot:150136-Hanusia_phi.AAC.3
MERNFSTTALPGCPAPSLADYRFSVSSFKPSDLSPPPTQTVSRRAGPAAAPPRPAAAGQANRESSHRTVVRPAARPPPRGCAGPSAAGPASDVAETV